MNEPAEERMKETLRTMLALQENFIKTSFAQALAFIGMRAHLDALKTVVSASDQESAKRLEEQIAIEEKNCKQEIETLNTQLQKWLAMLQSSASKWVQ